MVNDIRFWMILSELNSLTTILSVKCPEYEQRVSLLKEELTEIINEGLEQSKKLNNVDNWYVRNN
jgi:chorismate-pyruvate lyase